MQFHNESEVPTWMSFSKHPPSISILSPTAVTELPGHAVFYVQWFLSNNFSSNSMKEDRAPPTPPRSALGLRNSFPRPDCLLSGPSRWPLPGSVDLLQPAVGILREQRYLGSNKETGLPLRFYELDLFSQNHWRFRWLIL